VSDWVDVAGVDEVPDRAALSVEAHGYPLALFRIGDTFSALWARCPHAGGPLDDGYVKDDVVVCPWHGSAFRITTGERLDGPARTDATVFPVEVSDGRVLVGPPPRGTEPAAPSFLGF
jgi:nitrite reductase/ring-hydroxylating ferredoxin subunit